METKGVVGVVIFWLIVAAWFTWPGVVDAILIVTVGLLLCVALFAGISLMIYLLITGKVPDRWPDFK